MTRSRERRKRAQRRRWLRRERRGSQRARHLAGVGGVGEAAIERSLGRGGLEVVVTSGRLYLAYADYHAAPVHLSQDDLRGLGLALRGIDKGRPASVATAWAGKLRGQPDRATRGPALEAAGWSLPPGICREGVLVARVQGGLDIFAIDYHAGRVCLSFEELDQLDVVRLSAGGDGQAPEMSRGGRR